MSGGWLENESAHKMLGNPSMIVHSPFNLPDRQVDPRQRHISDRMGDG
jgi:hypothetical protein